MPDAPPGRRPNPPGEAPRAPTPQAANAAVDCGWGRLLFGQTFSGPEALAEAMRAECPDRRDIAFYVDEPHVLLAMAPQELFLDPSHTFRLDLATDLENGGREMRGFTVRRLDPRTDADAVNRIYAARRMVPVPPEFFERNGDDSPVIYLAAEDERTGRRPGGVPWTPRTSSASRPATTSPPCTT